MVEVRKVSGGRVGRVADGRDQPVDRLVTIAAEGVFDDADPGRITAVTVAGGHDLREAGAVLEGFEDGITMFLRTRHNRSTPVLEASLHSSELMMPRSAMRSVPPVEAANTACVPHSTRAATLTYGYALRCCPRPELRRPGNVLFASVSGTSKTVLSSAANRHPRYQGPAVSGAAIGRHTRVNSVFNGSGPNRQRALPIAPVVGNCHGFSHCRTRSRLCVSSRATSS